VRAETLAFARFLLKVKSQRSVALTVEVLAQIPVSIQVGGLRLMVIIDTGFDGWLSLPLDLIQQLNLI
jgi:predicted aspartyl protease